MSRFYRKYHAKTADQALALLLRDVRKSPPKIATILRSVAPDQTQAWFGAHMRAALKGTPAASLSDDDLAKLYRKYGIDKFNLNDRGYIASVHPLELWTVNYLRDHPLATLDQIQQASRDARAFLRGCNRRIGRPARCAGATDRHRGERGPRAAQAKHRDARVRKGHALRNRFRARARAAERGYCA
jgi:hypothetical protein